MESKLIIGYRYFFYFVYNRQKKKSRKSKYPSPIPMVVRVQTLIGLMQIIFMASLFFEYAVICKKPPRIEHPIVLFIPFIIWSVFDLWFHSEKRAKKYFLIFSSWPDEKKKKWNRIMLCIEICIIINALIAMYMTIKFYK